MMAAIAGSSGGYTNMNHGFAGLHTLTVNDCSAGAGVPPNADSHPNAQEVRYLFPRASDSELSKVVVDGLPFRKVKGQHAPLATSPENVLDCTENLPQTDHAWSAQALRENLFHQQSPKRFPLLVGKIGVISAPFHSKPPRLGGLLPPYLALLERRCPVEIESHIPHPLSAR